MCQRRAAIYNCGQRRAAIYNCGQRRAAIYNFGQRRTAIYNFGQRRAAIYNCGQRRTAIYNCGQRRTAIYNCGQRRTAIYNCGQRREAIYKSGQRRAAIYNCGTPKIFSCSFFFLKAYISPKSDMVYNSLKETKNQFYVSFRLGQHSVICQLMEIYSYIYYLCSNKDKFIFHIWSQPGHQEFSGSSSLQQLGQP